MLPGSHRVPQNESVRGVRNGGGGGGDWKQLVVSLQIPAKWYGKVSRRHGHPQIACEETNGAEILQGFVLMALQISCKANTLPPAQLDQRSLENDI